MQQKTSRLSYLSRFVIYRWVLKLVWQGSHTNLKELNSGKTVYIQYKNLQLFAASPAPNATGNISVIHAETRLGSTRFE